MSLFQYHAGCDTQTLLLVSPTSLLDPLRVISSNNSVTVCFSPLRLNQLNDLLAHQTFIFARRLNITRKTALSGEIIITGVRFTQTSTPAELDQAGNHSANYNTRQTTPKYLTQSMTTFFSQFFTHMDVIYVLRDYIYLFLYKSSSSCFADISNNSAFS